MIITYGTHDTEKKKQKKIFFSYNFNNAISQLLFNVLVKHKPTINQITSIRDLKFDYFYFSVSGLV